ncbi:MAG: hypothetical protein WAN49_22040 [Pseudolabrys sp.]
MNLIAEDLRNSIVELRFEFDLLVLQINLHKRQNRQDKLIDVDESLFLHVVFEHRTKVFDNVARPVAIGYNSIQSFAHLCHIVLFQPAKGRLGICQYG